MQTLKSEYDIAPITVDDSVPIHNLRWLTDRIHVGISDVEVARDFFRRTRNGAMPDGSPIPRALRKETVLAALWLHRENRAMCGYWNF